MKIDPDAVPGRFSARFAYHDRPEIFEELERVAATVGTSSASLVRTAVRRFLREVDLPAARRAGR